MAKLAVEATVQVQQPITLIVKDISAHGSNRANALAVLQKKIAGMVGGVLGGSLRIKEQLAPALVTSDYPAHASTQFEDAEIFVHQLTNGVVTDTAVIQLKNMSTAYALPGNPAVIDHTLPDVANVASNHADSAGNKGFTAYYAKYVD